jgi:hypothetical protein
MNNYIQKELIIRTLKILDIMYLNFIFTFYGLCCAYIIDYMYKKFNMDFNHDKYSKKSTYLIYIEIVTNIWINSIIVYIMRNILEHIPFPLDGMYNFEHKKVGELKNGISFSFFFIIFQINFNNKLRFLINKVYNPNNKIILNNP